MIVVRGISRKFEGEILESRNYNIIKYWFREVDKLYFSGKKYFIVLSDFDKQIISKFKDCYEKLQILKFKNNIELDEFFRIL